jgi:hypothetical protein
MKIYSCKFGRLGLKLRSLPAGFSGISSDIL